ncbi:MAG: GNAT family N-acetyltransferase [Nitrospira sp.]|nr:GNAT family N-acetyltransferase [Nitrospira sp.]
MPPGLEIIAVPEPHRSGDFIELAWEINGRNPDWVPPLRIVLARQFNRAKHPFFNHGDAAFFIAKRDGVTVGRIAAIENRLHVKKYDDGAGFFGLFECKEDDEAARALLGSAARWLKERGFETMRGPLNYSLNDENPGVLVDGFDGPPVVMMAHNPEWYGPMLERTGLSKCKDLYAFYVNRDVMDGERFARVTRAVERRNPDVKLREIRMDRRGFMEDIETLMAIFNAAWADNWGMLDVTPAETEVIAKDLKPVARKEFTAIAEIDGKPVGMIVCVPDINRILVKNRRGRLLPFGWWPLVTGLKKLSGMRTMLMGVVPEYRNRGIDAMLIGQIMRVGVEHGQYYCELSWVLEDNTAMVSLSDKVGAKPYRTYRIYEGNVEELAKHQV